MFGVAGGMTTRVRHGGAGAGGTDGMVVVPSVGGINCNGDSVDPEVWVVDTAGAGCVGVETIEVCMGACVIAVGTGGETSEMVGGRSTVEPEATMVGMLGRAPSKLSQS